MSESINAAFRAWWDSVARQGDPIRRPRLVNEAFEAGYRAASGQLLTVEDQFAMHAMQALVSVGGPDAFTPGTQEHVAKLSYYMARSMLKARQS